MKVVFDKTENHTSYLNVEIDLAEIEKYKGMVSKKLGRGSLGSGIESAIKDDRKYYLDKEEDIEDVVKDMVPVIFLKNTIGQKIDTDVQPLVKIIQKNPLKFEIVAPLKPEVEIGDYNNMRVMPESLDIRKEEVGTILEKYRNMFLKYEIVERKIQEGDTITIDLESSVEGALFINKKGIKIQVVPEIIHYIPGLFNNIIGMRNSEEKEYKTMIPEDYKEKTVAGKVALFKVKIYEVRRAVLPKLNDDFANMVAPGVKTLDLLKERIEKNMIIEREQNAYSRFANKIMDSLILISSFKYSPLTIDMKVRTLIVEHMKQLKAACSDDMECEEKLKQVSEDELKKQLLPVVEKKIRWSLIINKIAELETINIDSKDIDEQIEMMICDVAQDLKEEQRDYLNLPQNHNNVYELLKAKVVIKKLVDIVESNNGLEYREDGI